MQASASPRASRYPACLMTDRADDCQLGNLTGPSRPGSLKGAASHLGPLDQSIERGNARARPVTATRTDAERQLSCELLASSENVNVIDSLRGQTGEKAPRPRVQARDHGGDLDGRVQRPADHKATSERSKVYGGSVALGGKRKFAVPAVRLFDCGKADIALGLRMRTQVFTAINTWSTTVFPP